MGQQKASTNDATIERLPTPEIQVIDSKPPVQAPEDKKLEESIELGILTKLDNDVSQQSQVGKQNALAEMLNPEKKYMSGWRLYCLTFGWVVIFLLWIRGGNADCSSG
jgi:hypothetical protein